MSLVLRALFRIPIIGWLVRDAIHGRSDARYYFMANLLFWFALLLCQFGYPFLIFFALAATGLALSSLIALTAADAFKTRTPAPGRTYPTGRTRRRY